MIEDILWYAHDIITVLKTAPIWIIVYVKQIAAFYFIVSVPIALVSLWRVMKDEFGQNL